MTMRTLIVAGLAMLSACGSGQTDDDAQSGLPVVVEAPDNASAPSAARPAALTIPCAPPGEAAFRQVCAVDRLTDARGQVLTIRLPDGGFRRLRVSDDGRDVTAADGSERAAVRRGAEGIEVELGGARFRLPARTGANAPG
jgi:hypothetical protein